MIAGFQEELMEHKKRLVIMEQAELERRAKEQDDKEYKAMHAGKPRGFFKMSS